MFIGLRNKFCISIILGMAVLFSISFITPANAAGNQNVSLLYGWNGLQKGGLL